MTKNMYIKQTHRVLAGVLALGIAGAATVTAQSGGDYADLDLREAHVLDVTFTHQGGNQYRFDVTLIHDDAGEAGYADWWQVETRSGEPLGRRTLLHAHGSRPFTRSETITIPDGVTEVVVRGRDQTHEYGGTAMIVNLSTGEMEAVDQGPEPTDFSR
ncbi:MAG: hypothetical protein PF508_13045 [Spirochaeta sp.]|nr:hypothetical protein [Spirochaeta sp.]